MGKKKHTYSRKPRKTKIPFQQTQDSDLEYIFSRISNYSAAASVINQRIVRFSWPPMKITLWPHQMVRIPLGWATKSIPPETIIFISGSQRLMQYGIVTINSMIHSSNGQTGMSLPVMNVTNHPIYIENGDVSKVAKRILTDKTQQQIKDFDWGEFMSAILSQAVAVIPVILNI